jgi:hypothetical protein
MSSFSRRFNRSFSRENSGSLSRSPSRTLEKSPSKTRVRRYTCASSKELSRTVTRIIRGGLSVRVFVAPPFPVLKMYSRSISKEVSFSFSRNYSRSKGVSGYLLRNWFGANSRQDANYLYISKADLVNYGLVPNERNSLDELFFFLNRIWIENKSGHLSVEFYRSIVLNENGISFIKESYLIKVLLKYNGDFAFPSPDTFSNQ